MCLITLSVHWLYAFYFILIEAQTIDERVVVLSVNAPAPAQSAVCTDTTNVGEERNHIALQSGIGQVLFIR